MRILAIPLLIQLFPNGQAKEPGLDQRFTHLPPIWETCKKLLQPGPMLTMMARWAVNCPLLCFSLSVCNSEFPSKLINIQNKYYIKRIILTDYTGDNVKVGLRETRKSYWRASNWISQYCTLFSIGCICEHLILDVLAAFSCSRSTYSHAVRSVTELWCTTCLPLW